MYNFSESSKSRMQRFEERMRRAGLKPMQLHWAPHLWGPALWFLGRLFIFANYTLRLRIQ